MSHTYKLNRTCPTCGKSISDKNKSGYCNRHRDRTGTNNTFYGKTHSQETINSIKEKSIGITNQICCFNCTAVTEGAIYAIKMSGENSFLNQNCFFL